MHFFSTSSASVQRCLYPLFQNQHHIFYCPIFFKEYLNPQVRINKMVNETYCRLPHQPFTINFKDTSSDILWTPKVFIFPEYFLNFFLNLYIPPWLQKSFKFLVLRLLVHLRVKNESVHFFLMPLSKTFPQVLVITPRQKEITHSS